MATGIQVSLALTMKPSALEGTHKLIYNRFHETIGARDVEGLMQIYGDDAILDSSLVHVLEKDPSGIIQGKQKLRAHFQGFFDAVVPSGKEWFRPDTVLSDGQRLMWEYPSQGPDGDQLDVVESFDLDLEKGLIAYHRVYWGRVGHKLLTTAFK